MHQRDKEKTTFMTDSNNFYYEASLRAWGQLYRSDPGRPMTWLNKWLSHNKYVIKRQLQLELNESNARSEILGQISQCNDKLKETLS